MKKHQFNVNTAGLTAYVNENDTQLLYQLAATSSIMPYATVRTGIKGTERLHFMSTNATFQTDSCAYNASGTTTFTEKNVTVGKIAIMEDICTKSLNGFWTEQILAAGSNGEEAIPSEIARAWMEKKLNLIKKQLNVADWQGDTGSGTANLNKYNGLLKEIFADGSVVDGNTSDASTATSSANIIARINEMYAVIPDDIMDGAPDGSGLVLFLGMDYFKYYVQAGRVLNYFNYVVDENNAATFFGTNIKMVPQVGLTGTNKMVLTTEDNIVIATDLESDEDAMDVWYSKDDRINHSLIAFKRGITYKYSNYIVKWGLGTS